MFLVIKMAWRNIWRNKRRSLLTLSTVVFSVTVIIFFIALTDGAHEQMIVDAIEKQTGNLQIHALGYQEFKNFDYLMYDPSPAQDAIPGTLHIVGSAPRLKTAGLISSEKNSIGGFIFGLDPQKEGSVSSMPESIIEGTFVSDDDPKGIVLGEILAKNLDVSLGDEIVILSQGADGSLAAGKYFLKGLIKSNTPDLDNYTAILTLKAAQELLSAQGFLSEIAIRLDLNVNVVATIKELRGKLNLEKFEVLSWEEILPGLVQFIKLDNAGAYVALLILLIVVVFGVMNTTLMSTMERIREFGVMKALGTTPIQIVALVFLETFFITLVGVAIGTLFGCLLSWYYSIYPIDFSFLEESIRAFGIDPMMYCMLTFRGLAWSIGTVSISSLVFCIYPAVHASRFRAAEALRHT